jgi:uncharacterized membrane protein YbaN (DUF454 family)
MNEQVDAKTTSPVTRWLLIAAGVICIVLAAVGAVMPVLPTTIFLLGAVACFARSSPRLERKLVQHRLFAPYMPYIYGNEPLPRRARVTAMIAMWTCVLISLAVVVATTDAHPIVPALLLGLGGVATVTIVTWRRDAAGKADQE